MSEQLRDLPQRQEGTGLPLMPLVLERLHAVYPELIEAVADARAEGSLLATGVGATEIIAPQSGPIGSSLDLTHLPHHHPQDYEGPGLLEVAVHDSVEGNYFEHIGPETSVTSKLRLAEDGQVDTAMVLCYVAAHVPRAREAVVVGKVPLIDNSMPRKLRIKEVHEGAGNPAKIRARAIDLAHKIVEWSQASEDHHTLQTEAA